ncbi:hypothetical protein IB276_17745 [Ensifer sp. ENS04]|uniref:hypothetical protein n=1 Tax=Ensifer sp. ENS04 TaxID=2769281 RepID=UPI00178006FE|nr:hypothetical protein [Ensifer sp. ENS04]MBD9541302.1 hypothetical protein [Ensifer sp. ENS04]
MTSPAKSAILLFAPKLTSLRHAQTFYLADFMEKIVMAPPKLLPDTEDVMIDIDHIDRQSEGQITDVKKFTIRRLATKHGLSPSDIAQQLKLDENDVRMVMSQDHSLGFSLK